MTDIIKQEQRLWTPEGYDAPADGTEEPEDKHVHINTVPGEMEPCTEEELAEEIKTFGRLREPEIGREKPPPPNSAAGGSYIDDYPTHFNFRGDVAKAITRMQKKFPYLSFCNSYIWHPPVPGYGHLWEYRSFDVWGGGFRNGNYAGYRGKTLGSDLGWKMFNAIFNDPNLPNIAWIIWAGKMWVRGTGWGLAPWGPAGSDAGHWYHIHCSMV